MPDLQGDRDKKLFIIKTYSFITIMIGFTIFLSGIFSIYFKILFDNNNNMWFMYWLSLATIFFNQLIFNFFHKWVGIFPINFFFLFTNTLSYSYILAV